MVSTSDTSPTHRLTPCEFAAKKRIEMHEACMHVAYILRTRANALQDDAQRLYKQATILRSLLRGCDVDPWGLPFGVQAEDYESMVIEAAEKSQEAAQLHKRATRIMRCQQDQAAYVDEDGSALVLPWRCRDRACPRCGAAKAFKLGQRVEDMARLVHKQGRQMRVLTLTQRGDPHQQLRGLCSNLRAMFSEFRRHTVWAGVWGAMLFVESPRSVREWVECSCVGDYDGDKRPRLYGSGRASCPYCGRSAEGRPRVRVPHYNTHAHILVWWEEGERPWEETDGVGSVGEDRDGKPVYSDVARTWSAVSGIPLGELRVQVQEPFALNPACEGLDTSGVAEIDAAVSYATKYACKGQAQWSDVRDILAWLDQAKSIRFFDTYGQARPVWAALKKESTMACAGSIDELEIRAYRHRERLEPGESPAADKCPQILRDAACAAGEVEAEAAQEVVFLTRLYRAQRKVNPDSRPIHRALTAAKRKLERASGRADDLRAMVAEYDDDRAAWILLAALREPEPQAPDWMWGWAYDRTPQTWGELRERQAWVHEGALWRGGSLEDVRREVLRRSGAAYESAQPSFDAWRAAQA